MSTPTRRTHLRRLKSITAGASLVLAFALTGCGDGPSIGDAIDAADGEGSFDTDGDGKDDVSVDRDGQDVRIGDGENELAVTAELPADFPDSVPLIDGEVTQGSTVKSEGTTSAWTVVITHDGDLTAALDRVASDLTGAGHTELYRSAAADGAVLSFNSDEYAIQVVLSVGDSGDTLVSYTVAESNSGS